MRFQQSGHFGRSGFGGSHDANEGSGRKTRPFAITDEPQAWNIGNLRARNSNFAIGVDDA